MQHVPHVERGQDVEAGQARDRLRVVESGAEGHERAAVMAGEGEALVAEGRGQRDDVGGHRALVVARRRACRCRRTRAGRGRSPCGRRERGGDVAPHQVRLREAVQEHDRRTVAARGHVQGDAVGDRDAMVVEAGEVMARSVGGVDQQPVSSVSFGVLGPVVAWDGAGSGSTSRAATPRGARAADRRPRARRPRRDARRRALDLTAAGRRRRGAHVRGRAAPGAGARTGRRAPPRSCWSPRARATRCAPRRSTRGASSARWRRPPSSCRRRRPRHGRRWRSARLGGPRRRPRRGHRLRGTRRERRRQWARLGGPRRRARRGHRLRGTRRERHRRWARLGGPRRPARQRRRRWAIPSRRRSSPCARRWGCGAAGVRGLRRRAVGAGRALPADRAAAARPSSARAERGSRSAARRRRCRTSTRTSPSTRGARTRGACSRSPSIAPAARPTPSRCCAARGRCWSSSSALDPGPALQRLETDILDHADRLAR